MKIRTVAVSLLAIALFAWFLSRANLADVGAQVRHARPGLLVAALGLVAITFWVRAVRWQYLLAPIGPTRFRTAFRTTVIGFAALSLLPARAGDLLRPYLLARQDGISAPAAFATIVMERVLDLIAVLILLAVYVWGFSDPSTLPPTLRGPIEVASALAGLGAVVMMVVMWVLATHPERIGAFVAAATRVLPRKLGARLGAVVQMFSGGFAVARKPRSLAMAFIWSLPLWLILAGEIWLVSRAFNIHMPFPGSFLLQALLVIGVAVPTPGAVGSYHEAFRLGVTTFFGTPNDAAVAAAIVVHAVGFFPIVLVGLVFMAQDGLSVRGLQALTSTARREEMPDANEVSVLRSSER
jgi:glycosyltransferase 2 family protein